MTEIGIEIEFRVWREVIRLWSGKLFEILVIPNRYERLHIELETQVWGEYHTHPGGKVESLALQLPVDEVVISSISVIVYVCHPLRLVESTVVPRTDAEFNIGCWFDSQSYSEFPSDVSFYIASQPKPEVGDD